MGRRLDKGRRSKYLFMGVGDGPGSNENANPSINLSFLHGDCCGFDLGE